jgi:mono/diheme cytochrome c family protein
LTAKLLDNQITKPEILIQRIAFVVLAILLSVLLGIFAVRIVRTSDPYVKSVLSRTGDPVQGHAIFQINCAGCHGWEADGRVGPSLQGVSKHKSRYDLIHQVISGDTPPMPKFQPSTQTMADLLSYLETL